MIGLRAGLAIGLRAGVAASLGSDQIVPDSTGANTTLTVALADSADPVITAVAFSYSLVVTNTGSVTANSVTTSVTLDSSLTYGSASGAGWSVDTSALPVVTFTRATLSVGAAPTITINVTSGGSAITASSTGNASASNASAATPSTQTTTIKLVTKDATSGIRCPATSTEWTDFIAYYGLSIAVPSALWLLQDASGNPADAIGAHGLTAAGTGISYQNAVSGWSRKAINTTASGTGAMTNTAGDIPNILTTSCAILGYVKVTTPASTLGVLGLGTTVRSTARLITTPRIRYANGAGSTDGTSDPTGSVRPLAIVVNRTGSAEMLVTDQEKLAPTFDATPTGQRMGLGADTGVASCAGSYLYACAWFASNGEITSANMKALLQALGWAIPWS